MNHEHTDGLLTESDWEWASKNLPIACVDILPIQYDHERHIWRVGLILRDSPFGWRWCHVGGRIRHGEQIGDAARRHLRETLQDSNSARMSATAYMVNQYFPTHVADMGLDPRKHAVAPCLVAEFERDCTPVTTGDEGVQFQWFTRDALPDESNMWPGTMTMILHPAVFDIGHDVLETYHALSDRYVSHNQLMWQTPALAMTSMAFLLTIALSDAHNWMRSLAAGLSTIVAVISAQLMAKHSANELEDVKGLEQIERHRGMLVIHAKREVAQVSKSLGVCEAWFARQKSRVWWFWALVMFAAVSSVTCILAVTGVR